MTCQDAITSGVAVIGGGTMGAMALWQLARRGVRATCLEQFSPGHDRGAGGGETRIFRTAYAEGAEYVPLLRDAAAGWRALERESGRELLTLGGVLTVAPRQSREMARLTESIERFGLPHEWLDGATYAARCPQFAALGGAERAVLDPDGGFIRADLALVAAASRAVTLGATIERYRRVEAVTPDADGVTVVVDGERRRFATVVLAAGPWSGQLLPALSGVLTVKRVIQAWFAPRRPERYAAPDSPVISRSRLDDTGAYALPCLDGVSVKVGTSSEGHRVIADPDRLDRSVDAAEMERLRDIARWLLPEVHPDPIRCGVYVEAYSPDHHALVGRVPGAERIVLLAGFSGHGFKLAPVIGEIAAEMVVDGDGRRELDFLAPGRFAALRP